MRIDETSKTGADAAISETAQAWPIDKVYQPTAPEPTLTDIQKSASEAVAKVQSIADKLVGGDSSPSTGVHPGNHIGFMARTLADLHALLARIEKAL